MRTPGPLIPGTVLITGASSGIGEHVAYAFARRKCSLFLVARRKDRLERVAERCKADGAPRVVTASHDLSRSGEGGVIVNRCLERLEGLDILICNAGYGIAGPVHEVTSEQMARIWQVNYQSGYESIHRAVPHFFEQGKGYVVLISSILGKKAFPLSSAYCATKFAQVGLGESLWNELGSAGIGVSVVCPGYTLTEFQKASERTSSMKSRIRRVGGQSPERVARAVLKAVEKRKREVHLTLPGQAAWYLGRLVPTLTLRLMGWAARSRRSEEDTPL